MMENIAQDLFLLTANLSQLGSKDLVIKLFIESVNSIFLNVKFTWSEENVVENERNIIVCTRNKTYGFVQFNENLSSNTKMYSMLFNACQIVALIIERIEHEELLSNQKEQLQILVDEQTKDIISSRDEIKSITENSPDIIMRFDRKGRHLFTNSNIYSITGIKAENFIGKTHKELGFPIELCNLWEKKINEVFEIGKIVETDFDFKGINNNYTFNWRLIPEYDNKKEVVSVLSISRDITERKQSGEKIRETKILLQAAIESQKDMIILLIDKNYKYLYFNSFHKHVMETAYGKDIKTGMNLLDCITDSEDRRKAKLNYDRALNGESHMTIEEFGDLDRYYYETKYNPIINDKNVVIGATAYSSNVTERKQAEEALKESEEKHRLLVESSHDIIYTITTAGLLTFISPAWTTLLGHPVNEVVGKSFQVFVHPDDVSECFEWLQKVIETGKRQEGLEYRVRHTDGQWLWHTSSAVPLRDKTNKVIGFEGTARDITAQKEAENKIKESELRLAVAIDGTEAGIWDWNMLKNEVAFSEQWKKMLGYEDYEIENSFEGWKKLWHPDDVERIEKSINDYLVGITERYEIIYRCLHKDKSWRWIITRGKILKDKNSTPYRWIGTNIDITELKQAEHKLQESEEKLSTLFASMTEMVVLHELVFNELGEVVNYRITDCNNAFTEITGITKENAIGKLATEVFNTETPPYLEQYSTVGLTGEPYEYSTYFAPMDKHFMISVVCPIENSFATITTDITAIKQIQEVISAKNKELENYLYVASHDLRSPLVNIQGFSQRLQIHIDFFKTVLNQCMFDEGINAKLDNILNESIPKTLNFIYTNVAKMDILINGLLQISRTGQIKMTIKKIDMNKLFKTIISSFNFQLNEIDSKVIIEDLTNCYGDENLLNQLFSNIIGNAIKYRDKNRQLVLTIDCKTIYNKVIYSIKDNGIGIANRHLEKIWNVFYRVNSASPDAGEGLGLSIAKRITDKHKGKIWVESEEGEGTIFYIELLTNEFIE